MRYRPTRGWPGAGGRDWRRLLAPVPSVGVGLSLLVGSVTPAGSLPTRGVPLRAAAAPARTSLMPEASVTDVRGLRSEALKSETLRSQALQPGSAQRGTAQRGTAGAGSAAGPGPASPAVFVSGSWSVPGPLLAAYRGAVSRAPASCHLPVGLLAAIGQVESGSLAGRSIDSANRAVPPVLGPMLDGGSTAAIPDTDHGRLDGNTRWDRAVGPMQFIPGTWAAFGVDADHDGRADPQDVYDAAAAAGAYLCAGGRDLALASGVRSAVLAYNHSAPYLSTVLGWQRTFGGPGSRTAQLANLTSATPRGTGAGGRVSFRHSTDQSPPGAPAVQSAAATTGAVRTASVRSRSASLPSARLRSARKLVFTSSPSPGATSGTALSVQPVLSVQDGAGRTISAATSPVTLALTSPAAGARLTCAANRLDLRSGVARFTGCRIDRAGTYTLTATGGSGVLAISRRVTINAGAPALITVVPGSTRLAAVGEPFARPVVVRVSDAHANPVPGASVTFVAPSITPAAGPSPSGTYPGPVVTAASVISRNYASTATTGAKGEATSGVLTANTTAGIFGLTVRAGSVRVTVPLTNLAGPATRFAFVSAPVSGPPSGTADIGPITVQRQDSYGNAVRAPTGGTLVTLSSGSAGVTVFAATAAGAPVPSVTIPGGASSAAFYYGDSVVASPILTASGLLLTATQTETITAPPNAPPATG